ncbi:MAG TPA: right-handed parallel beta-helix repeat-containing protein [Burkholderiales bacterium]|nr:right-handed parallel beta-helix repeat-containing protein [Burkholderiales bacterium]
MTFRVLEPVLQDAVVRLRCALYLVLPIIFAHSVWAATYYVATDGSDSNSGTSLDSPFRTIQHAVNKAVAGDTVLVRGGTYREDVEMTTGGTADQPINIFAYAGEIPVIKGSDVVTGWTRYSSAIWEKTGWPYNSQQVFVDFDARSEGPLQQIGMPSRYYGSSEYPNPVGSGLSSMSAGTFYYDPVTSTLYVWLADGSDPNNHVMEASVRRRLLFMHKPYVHVKGLAFRHSNASAFTQQGAAVELSSHSVIESCDIQYTDFTGLSMGYLQDGAQVRDCNVSNNGDSGITASGSTNFVVTNVTLDNNNYRNFNPLWHAGGFKATTRAYGVIENSEVGFNNGSGIWFDYANSGEQIIVRNNYIHDNGPVDSAIFFEVSSNGLIYNNVLVNNRRRGIYLSAANGTRVFNNTIVGTAARAGIEVAGMPRTNATLTNNTVLNNIISGGTSKYDLYIMPDNGTTITGNRSDYNDIYRGTGSISLWSGNAYSDLSGWRSATRFGAHSLNANPDFVAAATPPSALDYEVMAGSPVIDAGTDLSTVPYDYAMATRPAGSAFDIGAFEAASPVAASTADTDPPVVILSDSSQASIKNSFTISASATDNVGVTSMHLYLDGALKASSKRGQISYRWKKVTVGSHEVKVTASDAAQNTGSATGVLTIQ